MRTQRRVSGGWTRTKVLGVVLVVLVFAGLGLRALVGSGRGTGAAQRPDQPAGVPAPGGAPQPQAATGVAPVVVNRDDPTGVISQSFVEVFADIGRASETTMRHVERLSEYASKTANTEDLIAARNALGVAADRLRNGAMAPPVRARLEALVIGALRSDNWRVRLTGLACVREAELLDHPGVADRVRALRADPEHKVRVIATGLRLRGEEVPVPASPAPAGAQVPASR